MTGKGQGISQKWLIGILVSIITGLLVVCWFFFTSFYQSTLEIQKSLQEIKLSVVRIQSEMLTEEKVRNICRYEIQINNRKERDSK